MGWARGSQLFEELICSLIEADVSDPQREIIYDKMYDAFRDMDWDTVQECFDIDVVFDNLVRQKEPDWFSEEDEEGFE